MGIKTTLDNIVVYNILNYIITAENGLKYF